MRSAIRTSRTAAAFLSGLLSVTCGVLTLTSGSDLFLVGVVFLAVSALVLGILGRRKVKQSPDCLRGNTLAGWGIGLPVGSVILGFLLLPAT